MGMREEYKIIPGVSSLYGVLKTLTLNLPCRWVLAGQEAPPTQEPEVVERATSDRCAGLGTTWGRAGGRLP